MDCAEVAERLAFRVYGELSPEETAAVDGHVAECPSCARDLAAARRVVGFLERLSPSRPPERVREIVLREAQRASRRRLRIQQLVWALPAAAAAAIALFYFLSPETNTPEQGIPVVPAVAGTEGNNVPWLLTRNLAELNMEMGRAEMAQGRYADAIRYFRRAVEGGPDPEIAPAAYHAMADCRMALGQSRKARDLYRLILARYPAYERADEVAEDERKAAEAAGARKR